MRMIRHFPPGIPSFSVRKETSIGNELPRVSGAAHVRALGFLDLLSDFLVFPDARAARAFARASDPLDFLASGAPLFLDFLTLTSSSLVFLDLLSDFLVFKFSFIPISSL